jgi:hypothetical protein
MCRVMMAASLVMIMQVAASSVLDEELGDANAFASPPSMEMPPAHAYEEVYLHENFGRCKLGGTCRELGLVSTLKRTFAAQLA